jgi:hypothetical protein
LKINRISSIKPLRDLFKGIVGMAIKNVEVSDSLSVEEWASYAPMKSGGLSVGERRIEKKTTNFHISPDRRSVKVMMIEDLECVPSALNTPVPRKLWNWVINKGPEKQC